MEKVKFKIEEAKKRYKEILKIFEQGEEYE
jgi:hypothetical protein